MTSSIHFQPAIVRASDASCIKLIEAKQVGLLEQGRIVSLARVYWPTADETLLKGGMLLPVRDVASQAMAN